VAGGQALKTVVVDASVVVKWFVEEEYSREARMLRDAYIAGLLDLAAPSLLPYEVLNALRYSRLYTASELREIARILDDYQFTLHQLSGTYAEETAALAHEKDLTVYDAAYVALAERLGTVLYTADERLLRKLGPGGAARHIASYGGP